MSNNSTVFATCNGTQSNNYLHFPMSASISVDILQQTSSGWQRALEVIYILLATIQFITSIIYNLLMIGTLLQTKILITSCGIYLLLFSFASLISMSSFYIRIVLTLYFNEEFDRHSLIHCRLSMITLKCAQLVCLWVGAFISVERVLIECFHFSIYRSRKYAIIMSLMLMILSIAASITWFIGAQTVLHPVVPTMHLCEFRQLQSNWKLVDEIITSIYIHVITPCLLHVLSILFILGHIIRRKIIFTDAQRNEWTGIMCQQLKKHKYFFIPPIVIITCTMPHEVLLSGFSTQSCVVSNTTIYLRLHIAFDFLYYIPQTVGFYIYIYPSKVYMKQFRKTWIVRSSKAAIATLFEYRKSRTSRTIELAHSSVDGINISSVFHLTDYR